jgi:hypothetical protein
VIREEVKTLGAEITATLRADFNAARPRKRSSPAPRSPTLEQPTEEDDIDGDAWGIGEAIEQRRKG